MDDASLIPGVRDFYLLLVLPIAAYWISASVFHLFDCQRWFQAYKIHTYEAGQKRNKATLGQVFRQVIAQQIIQVVFALVVDRALTPSSDAGRPVLPQPFISENTTWGQAFADTLPPDGNSNIGPVVTPASSPYATIELVLRVAAAIVVADLWQYSWHRIFHTNRFLYSKFK